MNNLPTYYIGHITEDLPAQILGGMVSYAAVADMRTLSVGGIAPGIITKVGWDEPVFQQLLALSQREGFHVHNIADESSRRGITQYQNSYDVAGRRRQHRYEIGPQFTSTDVEKIQGIMGQRGGNVTIGTVTGWDEMTPQFMTDIRSIMGNGMLSLAPQGWHRLTDQRNVVYHRRVPQDQMGLFFGGADLCVLSDEDVAFGESDEYGQPRPNCAYIHEIAQHVPMCMVTKGAGGVDILQNGVHELTIDAFPLTTYELQETNPTGLGDTFTAIVSREIARGIMPVTAVAFAHLVTAAKLAEGPGTIEGRGEGMASLLTRQQLEQFLTDDRLVHDPVANIIDSRRERVVNYAQYVDSMYGGQVLRLLSEDYGIYIEGGARGVEGSSTRQMRK